MTEVRDSREKDAGLRDQGPPFQKVFIIVRYASFKSTLSLYSTPLYSTIRGHTL